MLDERRAIKRRKFGYYMRVIDNGTQELVGYLSDISSRGFKLDSNKRLTVDKDFNLRLDLTSDVSDRSFIVFAARCRWSGPICVQRRLPNNQYFYRR
ncbi:MAG: PilZ domain-containing protein [Chloroflexi bacterium]|nr:PilZ domain-containing protein [Chloroflexota bacterium]